MEAKSDGSTPIKLEDITPSKYKCTFGHCPSVFKDEDGNIVIIGKKISQELSKQIAKKIGSDELAIIIDKELLSNI